MSAKRHPEQLGDRAEAMGTELKVAWMQLLEVTDCDTLPGDLAPAKGEVTQHCTRVRCARTAELHHFTPL